jgi:restriction system protein
MDAQPRGDFGMNAVLAAWHHRRPAIHIRIGSLSMEGQQPGVDDGSVAQPEILIPAGILNLGHEVTEGQLIEAVALPWFDILMELEKDPQFLHQLGWRKVEELIAGAYKREGWPEVILTPRSGDGGRDIIASRPGLGAIRIYDQVKAYSPGHVVTADEVRALFGVVTRDHNVSKGIVTTTATFAARVRDEWKEFMPYRLELKDGPALAAWLMGLKDAERPPTPPPAPLGGA